MIGPYTPFFYCIYIYVKFFFCYVNRYLYFNLQGNLKYIWFSTDVHLYWLSCIIYVRKHFISLAMAPISFTASASSKCLMEWITIAVLIAIAILLSTIWICCYCYQRQTTYYRDLGRGDLWSDTRQFNTQGKLPRGYEQKVKGEFLVLIHVHFTSYFPSSHFLPPLSAFFKKVANIWLAILDQARKRCRSIIYGGCWTEIWALRAQGGIKNIFFL